MKPVGFAGPIFALRKHKAKEVKMSSPQQCVAENKI